MAVVEQAIAVDRQDHRFHSWKGLLQLNVVGGEPLWDEALDNLRRAHSLCPGDATMLVALGYAEASAGNPEQAIQHLMQARRIDPVDPASFNSAVVLSLATFVAADYEAARRWATLALRDAPNLAQAHVYLALAWRCPNPPLVRPHRPVS
jgi:tetratricopeptide (TPR) repeat protein